MIPVAQVLSYVKAQPFQPFCLHMASGQMFEIRHPEMVKVGKSYVLVFSFIVDKPDLIEKWESVSLMLIESISHIDQTAEASA